MSWFDTQAQIDAQQTFLGPDGPAVDVTRFPAGDASAPQTLRAIVDWDFEANANKLNPSARASETTDRFGRRISSYCIVECLASQEIEDNDRFAVPRGAEIVLVNFLRQTGADSTMRSLLCEDPGTRTTKSPRLRN